MDSTDEEFHGSTSFTTKGRRTKRQRTTTTTSSSYIVGVGVGGYVENSYSSSASATPSPSTPDDHHDIVSDMTTEEEDTANCLILLAHGLLGEKRKRSSKHSSTPGLTGAPYECKTCNRTFPSFQALGGHRTSHKKVITPRPPKPDGQSRHDLKEVGIQVFPPIPSLKVEISPKITTDSCKPSHTRISNPDKGRVHKCSICGSEFPSGQALGGHMRRHRAVVAAPRIEDSPIDSGGSSRNILSLDLNLPAADDREEVIVVDSSHMVETKFHVFPTPALLDCHY